MSKSTWLMTCSDLMNKVSFTQKSFFQLKNDENLKNIFKILKISKFFASRPEIFYDVDRGGCLYGVAVTRL